MPIAEKKSEIILFDTKLKAITYIQEVTIDPHIAISQDKKYFVEIEDEYDGGNDPN